MQFSHTHQARNATLGKFTLVALLHAALALLVLHGLDVRKVAPSLLLHDVDVTFTADRTPPLPPPEPPRPVPQAVPPRLFVPPAIDTALPPEPAPLPATTADPAAPPARSAAQGGTVRSAVFADANGCALPAYPVRALRNGETGTTTLALLVGSDGRVTSARIERSSGSRDLDQAALHALSLCTFQPAMHDGVAEPGWARLAYVWTLD